MDKLKSTLKNIYFILIALFSFLGILALIIIGFTILSSIAHLLLSIRTILILDFLFSVIYYTLILIVGVVALLTLRIAGEDIHRNHISGLINNLRGD